MSAGLAGAADVPKEKIPGMPTKLRNYLSDHEWKGAMQIKRDSPEQNFLYEYISGIESALKCKTSQEQAAALEVLNTAKEKDYKDKVQNKNFKDDHDFRNFFEGFLQISTGMAKTLRKEQIPALTVTPVGVENILQMREPTDPDELLMQSMGIQSAPANETEKNILRFAKRIRKPVETFGGQGIPSFSETIGDMTTILVGIDNSVEDVSAPYSTLLKESIENYRIILMARKVLSLKEATDITKSLDMLRTIRPGNEGLKEAIKEPTIYDELDIAVANWQTVTNRTAEWAQHLLNLVKNAKDFVEKQIATLGEETYKEFKEKANAVEQEIERYQLSERRRINENYKDLFLQKLQALEEETSRGWLSQNERSDIIAELKNMWENLDEDWYEELKTIVTNMQKKVEQMPIVEQNLTSKKKAGAILALLLLLATITRTIKKRKKHIGTWQFEVMRGIVKPDLHFIWNRLAMPSIEGHLKEITQTIEKLRQETDKYTLESLNGENASYAIAKTCEYLRRLNKPGASSNALKDLTANILNQIQIPRESIKPLSDMYWSEEKALERVHFYWACARKNEFIA